MSYKKSIDRLKNIICYGTLQDGLDSLPKDISISTMTICCNFNAKFNIENITKWLKLNPDTVVVVGKRSLSTKKKNTPTHNITNMSDLLKEKTKRECTKGKKRGRKPKTKEPKQQKPKKVFYNQISIKILVPGKDKDKPVNVKLFKNGSVQMTGCVTLQDSLDALYNAINSLNATRAVLENGKIKDVPFCSKILKISDVYDYKIGMINSGFKIPFSIDRSKLLLCMQNDNMDVLYDRNIHASVIIKYPVNDDDVTMLVFEKGNIIITGAKNETQINRTYNYINKYLLSHYINIFKKSELSDNHIFNYLK